MNSSLACLVGTFWLSMLPIASVNAQVVNAQSNQCRQVSLDSGLYVQSEPSVYSSVVGTLPPQSTVTITNESAEDWARVSAPMSGYVVAEYLAPCGSTQLLRREVCYQLTLEDKLYIQAEPAVYSEPIGTVSPGEQVFGSEETVDSWLRITEPIPGYVVDDYFRPCQ